MNIYKISKTQFEATDPARKLIVHEHARRFAYIDLGLPLGTFALSWRSELIEPTLYQSATTIWVGIDQHLAAIDLTDGHIALSLSLTGNLLQLIVKNKLIAAVTETEIFLFNSNFSIRFIKGLPDIPDQISFDQTRIKVQLVDGQNISFDTGLAG